MISITLPWPDAALMPNRANGQHWAKTASKRAKAKELGWALAHNAGKGAILPDGDISLDIVFVRPNDESARDADGLLSALKPSLDGIALALKINDSRFWPITMNRIYGPAEVRITIGA
jgi:hypothetical protein